MIEGILELVAGTGIGVQQAVRSSDAERNLCEAKASNAVAAGL
jgi:hypothetical protein